VARPLSVVALALGLACASSAGGGGTPAPNDILTAEDIQADRHAWANTFEVVLRLRPEWLEPPDDYDFTDPGEVIVYLDGSRLGGVGAMQEVAAPLVIAIRYYDPATARRHFGLDHRGGVISVETQ
jgi:hypothetical protein